MSQTKVYADIWNEFNDLSKIVFKKSYPKDEAFNVTCAFSISKEVSSNIKKISDELKSKFPGNYYLPKSLYHATICSITKLPKIFDHSLLNKWKEEISEVTENFPPFELEVRGINHFHNVLFAQFFSKDERLFDLNKALVEKLNLKIKRNYAPHSTIAYFNSKPDLLFKEIGARYRDYFFGKMKVNSIELVQYDLHPLVEFYEPKVVKEFALKK